MTLCGRDDVGGRRKRDVVIFCKPGVRSCLILKVGSGSWPGIDGWMDLEALIGLSAPETVG